MHTEVAALGRFLLLVIHPMRNRCNFFGRKSGAFISTAW